VPALIDTLLSTPDTGEVVRDQIAAILALELARQVELGLTPAPRVFLERSNPWGQLLETPVDESPIVNVWFDTAAFDGTASNITDRQKCDATFNIDVYAFGTASEDGAGHTPGDEAAALAVRKMLRLVRQILMAEPYTYLGLPRGTVWKRWPQTLSMFQPQTDDRSAVNIVAGRLALVVSFNEHAPRLDGPALEIVGLTIKRKETGEVYFSAEYDNSAPPP
jgi:hypothetical protein